jgi:hypothetical protein
MMWKLKKDQSQSAAMTFPYRLEVLSKELFVTVHNHDIELPQGSVPCWTYVSDGLEELGQEEIVFTLQRLPKEVEKDFPREFFDLYATIHGEAKKGNIVHVGGFTIFNPRERFLGQKGQSGLMYIRAEQFPNIYLPPDALAAVMIKGHEVELIQEIGYYRIATLLGLEYHYYPCPPWSDRMRSPVLFSGHLEKSFLGKLQFAKTRGIYVRTGLKIDEKFFPDNTLPKLHNVEDEDEIQLRISREVLQDFKNLLDSFPEEGAFAFLTEPDPDANFRLVWKPGLESPCAIFPRTYHGNMATGCFLAIVYAQDLENEGKVIDDGFGMIMNLSSWKEFKKAIQKGESLTIASVGDGKSLRLEWY